MPLSDYEHWNEEAAIVWWNEEGKHDMVQEDYDDYDDEGCELMYEDDDYEEATDEEINNSFDAYR